MHKDYNGSTAFVQLVQPRLERHAARQLVVLPLGLLHDLANLPRARVVPQLPGVRLITWNILAVIN
jgi:hypothetical protein